MKNIKDKITMYVNSVLENESFLYHVKADTPCSELIIAVLKKFGYNDYSILCYEKELSYNIYSDEEMKEIRDIVNGYYEKFSLINEIIKEMVTEGDIMITRKNNTFFVCAWDD